jgi:hypothetical protein
MIDLVVSSFVLSLVIAGILHVTSAAGRVQARTQAESSMAQRARLSANEMMMQLRAGDVVVGSFTIPSSTTSYTTSDSSIVVQATGVDPATDLIKLSGVTDYLAFQFRSGSAPNYGTIEETIYRGATTSKRPDRINLVVAKQVSAVAYEYRIRDYYGPPTDDSAAGETITPGNNLTLVRTTTPAYGTATLPLRATPTTGVLPKVFINGKNITLGGTGSPPTLLNGVITSDPGAVYTPATATASAKITVTNYPVGGDVQIVYPVPPIVNGVSNPDLSRVSEVQADITFIDRDGQAVNRTIKLGGTVRLRNYRG